MVSTVLLPAYFRRACGIQWWKRRRADFTYRGHFTFGIIHLPRGLVRKAYYHSPLAPTCSKFRVQNTMSTDNLFHSSKSCYLVPTTRTLCNECICSRRVQLYRQTIPTTLLCPTPQLSNKVSRVSGMASPSLTSPDKSLGCGTLTRHIQSPELTLATLEELQLAHRVLSILSQVVALPGNGLNVLIAQIADDTCGEEGF